MPYGRYRKSYRGYKKSYRRRYPMCRSTTQKTNVADLASQAFSMAKYAYGVLNSEKKHFDATVSGNVTDVGVVYDISGISQGDTNNTRDGNTVRVKSSCIRCTFTRHASATATRIRWAVVLDRFSNGSTPAYTDIYEATGMQSFLNLDDQQARFKILRTGYVNLSGDYSEKVITAYKNISIPMRFNDSGGHSSNAIYWCQLSDEATNYPTLNLTHRIRFYDN